MQLIEYYIDIRSKMYLAN